MINRIPERYRGRIRELNGFWIWTGAKHSTGYGEIRFCYQLFPAHRFIFELLVGPVPKGMELHHKCETKHCCNPGHLEILTKRQHGGRHNSPQSKCKRGHDLTPENIYQYAHGRQCRRCCIERALNYQIGYRARKKAICQKTASH